ncbi:MAG: PHB depolymerase family esterase [Polyangiaceae bacterium]
MKAMTTCLAVCALLVACGSDDPAPAGAAQPVPAADAPPPADPATTADAAAPPPALPGPAPEPCAGKAPQSGDLDWKLDVGGRERVVHVHVPPSYDPSRGTPVVLDFHGFNSNASQQRVLSGMPAKADAAGFIAIHAEGVGTPQSWNAGACCGDAASGSVDDVAFVGKLLDEAEKQLCVDKRRVFATGMSNGGFLSHRLACELSNRIAAVAPVAGVVGVASCTPARPMSVLQFHGTLDGLVPYLGNPAQSFPSVADTVGAWAKRSGCADATRETFQKNDVRCVTHDGCKDGAEVSLCTVTGGGHTWPGGFPVPALGYTTPTIKATDMMWDFFVKHPLP